MKIKFRKIDRGDFITYIKSLFSDSFNIQTPIAPCIELDVWVRVFHSTEGRIGNNIAPIITEHLIEKYENKI